MTYIIANNYIKSVKLSLPDTYVCQNFMISLNNNVKISENQFGIYFD